MATNARDLGALREQFRATQTLEPDATKASEGPRDIRSLRRQFRVSQGLERDRAEVGLVDGIMPLNRSLEGRGQGFSFGGLAEGLFTDPFASAVGLGASAIQGAVLEPIESVGQLLNIEAVEEFSVRAQQGLYSGYESFAKSAGMEDNEIASVYATGDFMGTFAPIGAGIFTANLFLARKATLGALSAIRGADSAASKARAAMDLTSRYVMTGNFMAETTGAAAYGAILRPVEAGETRLGNTLQEAAFVGAARIVLGGLAIPLRGMQNKYKGPVKDNRAAAREAHEAAMNAEPISDAVKRADEVLNEVGKGRSLMHRLMSSLRGQDLIPGNEPYVALHRGTQDLHRRMGETSTMIPVRLFNRNDEAWRAMTSDQRQFFHRMDRVQVDEIIDVAREANPGVTFEAVLDPDGQWWAFSGLRGGMTPAQQRQFTKTGMFNGQVVTFGRSSRAELVGNIHPKTGKKADAGKAFVRMLDGKASTVRQKNISDLKGSFSAVEVLPIEKRFEELYQGAKAFIFRADEIAREGSLSMTGTELQAAARQGLLKLTDDQRLMHAMPGTAWYPDSFGWGTNTNLEIQARRQQAIGRREQIGQELSQFGDEIPPEMQHLVEEVQGINDMLRGLDLQSPEGIVASLAAHGPVAASLAPNTAPSSALDDFIDGFLTERGMNLELPETQALRAAIHQKFKRELTDTVDNELITFVRSMIDETADLEAVIPPSAAALAKSRGMILHSAPDGSAHVLEDITTGRVLDGYPSLAAVEADIGRMDIANADLMGGDLMPTYMGLPRATEPGIHDGLGMFSDTRTGKQIPDIDVVDTDLTTAESIESNFGRMNNLLSRIEDRIILPIMSRGVRPLIKGLIEKSERAVFWDERLKLVFEGMTRGEKESMGQFYATFVERTLSRQATTLDEEVKLATEFFRGHESAERIVQAVRSHRLMDDDLAREFGLDFRDYLPFHYSRIQPAMARSKGAVSADDVQVRSADEEAYWRKSRQKDLAGAEMNPHIVMRTWIDDALFERHVRDAYDQLDALRQLPHSSFTPERKASLEAASGRQYRDPAVTGNPEDAFALSAGLRGILDGVLIGARGMAQEKRSFAQRLMTGTFKAMGVKVEDSVVHEFMDIAMSNIYSSTMGGRASIVIRNMTQNMSNSFPRLGGEFTQPSMERAMHIDGMREVVDEGVVTLSDQSLAQAGRDTGLQQAFMEEGITATGGGPMSLLATGAIRLGLKIGRGSRTVGDALLKPFGASDDMMRAQAYFEHKLFTADRMERFGINGETLSMARSFMDGNRVNMNKLREAAGQDSDTAKRLLSFLEDGLPFHAQNVRDEFMVKLVIEANPERALRFIGSEHARNANYLYHRVANPAAQQQGVGSAFTIFGSYPQATFSMMRDTWVNGTPRQRVEYGMRASVMMGAYANIGLQTGIAMDGYFGYSPDTFVYAGGPLASIAANAQIAADASGYRRQAAIGNIVNQLGRTSIPGTGMYSDITLMREAANEDELNYWNLMGRPSRIQGQNVSLRDILYKGGPLMLDPGTKNLQAVPSEVLTEMARIRALKQQIPEIR